MKRFLIFLIGTLLCHVPISAAYYYYKGQKIPNGMYILQHRMSDGSVRSVKITNSK